MSFNQFIMHESARLSAATENVFSLQFPHPTLQTNPTPHLTNPTNVLLSCDVHTDLI